jgi:hypothetical protein
MKVGHGAMLQISLPRLAAKSASFFGNHGRADLPLFSI